MSFLAKTRRAAGVGYRRRNSLCSMDVKEWFRHLKMELEEKSIVRDDHVACYFHLEEMKGCLVVKATNKAAEKCVLGDELDMVGERGSLHCVVVI